MTTLKQKISRNSSDVLLPKFFKVYIPDESGDDLEIPISFNSFLPKSLPKSVTVESIYGKIWKTALRKCCDEVEKYVLVDGWKKIKTGENLQGGDFLTFEFDGSRRFNFCIYEQNTTCKKLNLVSMQTNDVEKESDHESRASDDVIVLDDDDDNNDDDYAANETVEAVDDDERQHLDDRENPYFTQNLKPNKKSQLRIPTHVVKDYDLNFPEKITIVDPLVHRYGTMVKKIKIQANGGVFVKGFGSVIRRNGVKISDKMMFELKTSGDDNLVHTIKVYIFP